MEKVRAIRVAKHDRSFIADGFSYRSLDRIVTSYSFSGLPPGQRAFITNFGTLVEDGLHEASWRIQRVIDGVWSDLKGDFRTPDEAQSALEEELDGNATISRV